MNKNIIEKESESIETLFNKKSIIKKKNLLLEGINFVYPKRAYREFI